MPLITADNMTATEMWTIGIAAYAAIVSTFVLGWDAYKWLASGAKLDVSASTNMKRVGTGFPDPKTYITVTARNLGDRPTTITNLCAMHFESWWAAYVTRRRPSKAFVITSPSQAQPLPYRFDVGDQWIGLANQDDAMVTLGREGYLFMIVYTSNGGRGARVRVRFPESDHLQSDRSAAS